MAETVSTVPTDLRFRDPVQGKALAHALELVTGEVGRAPVPSPTTWRTPTHWPWRSRLPVFLAACRRRRRAD